MRKSSPKIIGVDLGGTNVRAGLVEGSRIRKLESRAIRSRGSEKEVFDDLCSVIDAVMEKGVKGLGLGVPSLLDPKTGVIIDTTNIPSWKDVPLKRRLEKKYGVPVRLDNDANCFALGEQRFGEGKKCENFVGLILGTGLGAGIISRGRLHSGLDCGAGEFGMIPYEDSIVEHYASGQFFQKRGFDGADLAKRAAKGDAEAKAVFAEYGKHLAFAIKVILYTLAPEMIVMGGSVSHSYPHFKDSLEHNLRDFVYPTVLKKTKFKVAKVKEVAVLGAASLVLD